MYDTTTYTNCLRIERTDGFIICLTDLDKDIIVNDVLLGLGSDNQTYIASAGYTPTNMQSTSDNAVNNIDIEGILSSVGVQREDIIGGRYDFAKLHIFILDYISGEVIKRLSSGHWGEATIKDNSYVAEFRSLSQQLQQTIGRTYNPECDEQLGGNRCTIALGIFPKEDGKVTAITSNYIFYDTTSIEQDDYWVGAVLNWTSGDNDLGATLISDYTLSTGEYILDPPMANTIDYGATYDLSKTFTGSATSDGTTTTFTDSTRTEIDNTFVGLTLEFTSGSNNSLTRTITDFTSNVFTLDSALPVIVSNADGYSIDDTKTTGFVNTFGSSKDKVSDSTIGAIDYSGMYIEFTSGLNNGDFSHIASSTTGELTLTTPFVNNILQDDEYIIVNMTGDTYMSFGEILTVTDSQNFTATMIHDSIGTPVDDYFNYGKLKFINGLNDNLHMEVKDYIHATGTFELFLPMPFEVVVGDQFQVFAGCDKRLITCKDDFDNIINFQGFPYIPGQDQISKFGGQ